MRSGANSSRVVGWSRRPDVHTQKILNRNISIRFQNRSSASRASSAIALSRCCAKADEQAKIREPGA
jgi:hypothetical protein